MLVLFRNPHCWVFTGVFSQSCPADTSQQQASWPSNSYNCSITFPTIFCEPWMWWLHCRRTNGIGYSNHLLAAFWPATVLCDCLLSAAKSLDTLSLLPTVLDIYMVEKHWSLTGLFAFINWLSSTVAIKALKIRAVKDSTVQWAQRHT